LRFSRCELPRLSSTGSGDVANPSQARSLVRSLASSANRQQRCVKLVHLTLHKSDTLLEAGPIGS